MFPGKPKYLNSTHASEYYKYIYVLVIKMLKNQFENIIKTIDFGTDLSCIICSDNIEYFHLKWAFVKRITGQNHIRPKIDGKISFLNIHRQF